MANIENEEQIKRYLTVNPNLWMKADAKREEACEMLQNKQTGHFIVRESSQADTFALSMRVPNNLGKTVNHYLLLKSDLGFEAQGSNLYFPTLPSLLAHFCSYQSGGMPCLLRPPKKKMDKHSHIQGYFHTYDAGEDGESELLFNSRASGVNSVEKIVAPVLRQIHSVPGETNLRTSKLITPPPPVTCLVPKQGSNLPVISSNQFSLSSSFCDSIHHSHSNNIVSPTKDFNHRPFRELRQIFQAAPDEPGDISYASVEYDTTPDHNGYHPTPKLPPRTYLSQTEVEYSDPILSPDSNEYDEPGEILHSSIPFHRIRTTDESHSNHAHGFKPPPIPPKTASMLIETGRLETTPLLMENENVDASHEGKSGILHNCIRLNDASPLLKPKLTPIPQSNVEYDVYLEMDPKETSSEVEKDIELQVHHTIKHQNGSSFEESSAAYVNVMFNTIATMKGIKQIEQPFEIGFQSSQVPTCSLSNAYDPKKIDMHYNKFTPTIKHPVLPFMPPTSPLSPLGLNNEPSTSRKNAFGAKMLQKPSREDMFDRPLPYPRNTIDKDSLNSLRRSNSADLLETPARTLSKPPLLPKPKFILEKNPPHHRRSSSSHECYDVNINAQPDLFCKVSLTRKRSAPSPIEGTPPKPILRGCQCSPEQFSVKDKETRKVNFSGSTEVRELIRRIDQRLNSREMRLSRSRSPVTPNRPSYPPPPPPPPQNRRHSVSINQTSFTNFPCALHSSKHQITNNNLNSCTKGYSAPSNYMQPSVNGKAQSGHVQTLNRRENGSKVTRFNQEVSGVLIRDPKYAKDHLKEQYENENLQEKGGNSHSKPQSECKNIDTKNTDVQNSDQSKNQITRRSKYKKLRTPTQRVDMYISRLNGRAHPMANKINSFNKAILKRQQSDGKVNIEKTLEQVRRFIDGVKKHLLTEKVEVMTRKFREQIVENGTNVESGDISEDDLNERLDAICENCLYNIILRPIYEHLIRQIRDYLNKKGDIEKISTNINKGVCKSPAYLGIRENLIPPDKETRLKVTEIFTQLIPLHSPLRKLELLLDAVKLVYKSIRDKKHPNKTDLSLGADDFLPIFIYTLIHTGMKDIEVEFLYTWNLVDQNLLSGEGGYYLTTLCTAIEVLKQSDFNSKDEDSEGLYVTQI
eukprot:TRINITY_DN10424_c0_g1_i2.p1 TRINITY_DN10424_c0_g1~~TRINITY_DN10424_c0_g1_i2.p1  ORF type:complete len:1223 (+),score=157.94 TRINITY_DN10424_c0_g1_i2:245-3670(+)